MVVYNECVRVRGVGYGKEQPAENGSRKAESELPEWVNITEKFFRAVECLLEGELFHDENFGLCEAMSAIELMDPKMDAGMLCHREKKRICTFDEAVEVGQLKIDNLTHAEQILVIDKGFSFLLAWFEGHSLAQTVFTNLYLQKPYNIESRPLKVFSICTLKIVELIRDIVLRGMVYEEEDFHPGTFGFKLHPDLPEQRLVGMLRDVETELNEIIHSTSSDPSGAVKDDVAALNARIRFTRLFYQILSFIKSDHLHDQNKINACFNAQASGLELVNVILKNVETYAATDDDIMGFEPLANQRLLPPTFPRQVKVKSTLETYKYFEQLLTRLRQIFKIVGYTSFSDAFDYFIEIGNTKPCLISRSVMQILYLPEPSLVLRSFEIVDILRECVKDFVAPPSLTARSLYPNDLQVKECIDLFLIHCIRPFTSLIQVCGHNRARQRAKLSCLLEEFTALQDEADRLDMFLNDKSANLDPPRTHIAFFSSWILYHIIRIMLQYLLSGFELELYSRSEYVYVYWYISDFLLNWMVSCLSRNEHMPSKDETSKGSGKQRKGKLAKKRKGKSNEEEIVMYRAVQNICAAYYKVVIGFQLEGKIKCPLQEFGNESIRYSHRFAPFGVLISPPFIPYNDYQKTIAPMYASSPDALYVSAGKHLQRARMVLENVTNPDNEVAVFLKIVKTNFVAVKILCDGHKRGPENAVDFDFSLHHHYPLIKLK